MVFSSLVFLLIFLPIVLLCYYICPSKGRNLVLVLASIFFYAWGEPVYVLLMVASVVFNYLGGLFLGRMRSKGQLHMGRGVLILNILGNLGVLGVFKYGDFAIQNVNHVLGSSIPLLELALPIGLSFYTFQALSYIVDVYRGQVEPQKNFIRFATFLMLFPQLIAGPIVLYQTVEKDLKERTVTLSDFSDGAFRFSVGLSKKVLIANQMGRLFSETLSLTNTSVSLSWLGAVAFTLQIYFDFSGYSDMAIGLGRMFGFHFPENFRFPYMATSVKDFWSRWHISLGSWFKNYLYIPMGGNKKGVPRQILNLFVVWLLTGLWHGASWNFVVWGLYFFVLLLLEKFVLAKLLKRLPKPMQHIYSLLLILIGWVIFSRDSLMEVGAVLRQMVGINVPLWDTQTLFLLRNYMVILVLATILCVDWKEKILYLAVWKRPDERVLAVGKLFFMMALLILSMCFLIGDSYNPFLYFRF